MSLTSYRAAPPRVKACEFGTRQTPSWWPSKPALKAKETTNTNAALLDQEAPRVACRRRGKEAVVVLGRPGNDLLSRVLRHSTIGAEEFNGRVRDGIGFFSPRSNHRTGEGQQQARGQGPTPNVFRVKGLSRSTAVPDRKVRKADRPPVLVHGRAKGTHVPAGHEAKFTNVQRTWIMRAIKPIGQLVLVSSTRHRAYTPSLSTWSSSTALIGSTRFEVGFPLRCLQRLSRPYIATLHCGWRHNSSTRGTSIPVLSY
jgi:hypothetical protein